MEEKIINFFKDIVFFFKLNSCQFILSIFFVIIKNIKYIFHLFGKKVFFSFSKQFIEEKNKIFKTKQQNMCVDTYFSNKIIKALN